MSTLSGSGCEIFYSFISYTPSLLSVDLISSTLVDWVILPSDTAATAVKEKVQKWAWNRK
jgi:hypothetical protein